MSKYRKYFKPILYLGCFSGVAGLATLQLLPKYFEYSKPKIRTGKICSKEALKFNAPLPSRELQLKHMEEDEFDVLIVGGGATGTGVALDAASRGLKTCLVEKFDFASGTSSRSTKLIHGGVRYLQKAIFNLDLEQFQMVMEALSERANLLRIAPHLATELPIMLPLYKWWQAPYYWAGIKMYDVISGFQILKASYYLSKTQALEKFPMLKKDDLKGALVYYDGQQDDARMCLALALTAVRHGAVVSNYAEVISLTREIELPSSNEAVSKNNSNRGASPGRITGALVRDTMTNKEFHVRARCVVNATGPFTDSLRSMDQPCKKPICQPSSGVHIVLPAYYSPEKMGLLDPQTTDGRVIFFLPWKNCTIAGTTDNPCPVSFSPSPAEDEIQFILGEIKRYLTPDIKVRRGDVHSAWSGIRPLVRDPNSKNTQSIARNHIIEVSPSGLVTIAGGKWTTYRSMAEETVDAIYKVLCVPNAPCRTNGLLLDGAHGWHSNVFITLKQEFGMDTDVAKHLASTYGSKSFKIARLAELTGHRSPVVGLRLHQEYPFIEAEVKWACTEYAVKAVDVIAYRLRLSFVNVYAAEEALPRVVEIMAHQLHWSRDRCNQELADAKEYLYSQMGLGLKSSSQNVPINFTEAEVTQLMKKFKSIDNGNKGFLTVADLKHYLKSNHENISDAQLLEILSEVDTKKNGAIDQGDFLQFMSALKTGAIADSRFKQIIIQEPVPVYRSGGGV